VNLIHNDVRRIQTLKLRSLRAHHAHHRTRARQLNRVLEQANHAVQFRIHLHHALSRAEHDPRLIPRCRQREDLAALRPKHQLIESKTRQQRRLTRLTRQANQSLTKLLLAIRTPSVHPTEQIPLPRTQLDWIANATAHRVLHHAAIRLNELRRELTVTTLRC